MYDDTSKIFWRPGDRVVRLLVELFLHLPVSTEVVDLNPVRGRHSRLESYVIRSGSFQSKGRYLFKLMQAVEVILNNQSQLCIDWC